VAKVTRVKEKKVPERYRATGLRGIRKGFCLFLTIALFILPEANFSLGGTRLKGRLLKDKNAHWQIQAHKMSYLREEHLYMAEGDVVITRDGQVLSAQKAIYNEKTGIVQVSGNVKLTSNGDYLTGEMGIFDLNNYTGQIRKGKIFVKETTCISAEVPW